MNVTTRVRFATLALAMVALPIASSADAHPTDASPSPTPSAAPSDPCLSLGNLVSRPTFSTAACVVKRNALLVQTGYTNTATSGSAAMTLVSYPQESLATGIAQNVEFDFTPPSIARLSAGTHVNGDTDGSIGLKAQLGQSSKIIYGVNAAYTLQNGDAPFTGSGDGLLANLNASLTLSSALGLFASLGYNEQSAGTPERPARYHDVQPSLGATLSLPQNVAVFLEGFNQSSTALGSGGSFAFDTGLQKDVGSRLQLDAEYFDYVTIVQGAHAHSVGIGASYLFGP